MAAPSWRAKRDFVPALPAPIASLRSLPHRQKQSTGLFFSLLRSSLLVRVPLVPKLIYNQKNESSGLK